MNERISRLMDGEADAAELDGLCDLARSDAAMETWNCYHTIGDALRGEPAVTRNVGSAVARQLAAEPTVLAPRAPVPAHPNVTRIATWAWAAAASIAAVTVGLRTLLLTISTHRLPIVTVRLKKLMMTPFIASGAVSASGSQASGIAAAAVARRAPGPAPEPSAHSP